ncbi:MAG TPA: helix-turn-helix domain-containing protein [Myxococcaceae bacterium]|nr:helix-turn-helix domain-containing protein [Myxococcaceae bacterium]
MTPNALPGHTVHGAAFTEVVLEVFRLNGELLAAGDQLAAGLGLTAARWQVMGAVAQVPLTAAQIARRMGLARQSVHRTVGLLEREGVAERIPNPDHRSADLVRLTDRGTKAYAAISQRQVSWANRCASSLSLSSLETTLRTLRAVREAQEFAPRRNKSHQQRRSRS